MNGYQEQKSLFRGTWMRSGGIVMLLTAASCVSPQAVRTRMPVEQLFEGAIDRMEAKNYQDACPMLEEVTRRRPDGLGAKLELAKCYENMGRLASAWTQYTLVMKLAEDAPGQAERKKEAEQKAEELHPKLSTLTLEVGEEIRRKTGFEIRRNGEVVDPKHWGKPVAVDAGMYELSAQAPGYAYWDEVVAVPDDRLQVHVKVELIRKFEPNTKQLAGMGIWAVAMVTFGVSAVFADAAWLREEASREISDKTKACLMVGPEEHCGQEGVGQRNTALTYADVSLGFLATGSILGALGGLFFYWGNSEGSISKGGLEQRKTRGSSLNVQVHPLGAGMQGTW